MAWDSTSPAWEYQKDTWRSTVEGVNTGLALGNAMREARNENMLLPLKLKELGLQVQRDELGIQEANQRMDQEAKSFPLKQEALKRAKEVDDIRFQQAKWEIDDGTEFQMAQSHWMSGEHDYTPTFKSSLAATRWDAWKSKTALGQSIDVESARYQSTVASLGPELSPKADVIPRGELGRYTDEQQSNVRQLFKQAQDKYAEDLDKLSKLPPGSTRHIWNPNSGKSEVERTGNIHGSTTEAEAANIRALYLDRRDLMEDFRRKEALAIKYDLPMPDRREVDGELARINKQLVELGQKLPAAGIDVSVPAIDKLGSPETKPFVPRLNIAPPTKIPTNGVPFMPPSGSKYTIKAYTPPGK